MVVVHCRSEENYCKLHTTVQVLISNMQMLEILDRRRELGDGDWDWQAGRGWECHRLGDAEVCDCGWQRQ